MTKSMRRRKKSANLDVLDGSGGMVPPGIRPFHSTFSVGLLIIRYCGRMASSHLFLKIVYYVLILMRGWHTRDHRNRYSIRARFSLVA